MNLLRTSSYLSRILCSGVMCSTMAFSSMESMQNLMGLQGPGLFQRRYENVNFQTTTRHLQCTLQSKASLVNGQFSFSGAKSISMHRLYLRGGTRSLVKDRKDHSSVNPNHVLQEGDSDNHSADDDTLQERFQELEAAVKNMPHDPDTLLDMAAFLRDDMRDLDQAEAYYKRSIESNPRDVTAMEDYADFLREERRDLDGAEALLKRMVATAPFDSDALCGLAEFLNSERRDVDAAEALYRRAVEGNPSDGAALCDLADFLAVERRDRDGAEQLYKQALDRNPYSGDVMLAYASFMSTEKRNLTAAEDIYKSAVEAWPHDAQVLSDYANFLLRERRDLDGAEGLMQRSVKSNPQAERWQDQDAANELENFMRKERRHRP